jgi:hypothetical protein
MPLADLVPGDDLIAQPGHRARIGNHGVYKSSCGIRFIFVQPFRSSAVSTM